MKTLKLLAVILALFPLSQAVQAASVVNGDFSAGLSGWTADGDVDVSSGFAVLTSSGADTSDYGGTNGAILSQDLNVSMRQKVSFDFKFNAGDHLPYNDFSLVVGDTSHMLANVSSVGDLGSSGWQSYSFIATANFTSLMFVVSNFQDTFQNSTLFIDNVSVTNAPIPGAVWLFGSSLFGLLGMRRKTTFSPSL